MGASTRRHASARPFQLRIRDPVAVAAVFREHREAYPTQAEAARALHISQADYSLFLGDGRTTRNRDQASETPKPKRRQRILIGSEHFREIHRRLRPDLAKRLEATVIERGVVTRYLEYLRRALAAFGLAMDLTAEHLLGIASDPPRDPWPIRPLAPSLPRPVNREELWHRHLHVMADGIGRHPEANRVRQDFRRQFAKLLGGRPDEGARRTIAEYRAIAPLVDRWALEHRGGVVGAATNPMGPLYTHPVTVLSRSGRLAEALRCSYRFQLLLEKAVEDGAEESVLAELGLPAPRPFPVISSGRLHRAGAARKHRPAP